MAPTDTVLEAKATFLRSQVRLLSTPLTPPRNWQDRAPASEEGDLREKIVAEVLYKRTYPSYICPRNYELEWEIDLTGVKR